MEQLTAIELYALAISNNESPEVIETLRKNALEIALLKTECNHEYREHGHCLDCGECTENNRRDL